MSLPKSSLWQNTHTFVDCGTIGFWLTKRIFSASAEIEKPWLKSIITQECPDVEEIVSLTLSPLDLPGTIYGCNRTRANMVLQLKDKSQISKSVVVIALPSDPLREKQISESGLFEVDVNVSR